jgi:5'(3')-deoxyribonucleotidase|tara:strand:- start:2994 stop:3512 length:519 start_codon:yes stop_codon:yes gene_type:complete
MKRLTDLIEVNTEDLPSVYCDMDMVLCNFMKKADEVSGGDFVTADKDQRWKDISNTKNFWAELEWMPAAKRIHQMIIKYDAHILSAFSAKDPSSKNGKMKWLSKNTKFKRGNIHLVSRAQKQAFAKNAEGEPNVLIDDYIKNIKEWEAKGGIGIHHTAVPKTLGELKRLGFK